jgi:tetratricopeptide (TPR) repeat protein
MLRRLELTCALALLTLSGVAAADASVDFEAGKKAFGEGDYALAVEYFEQARDAGLAGPAVHYNIAVACYEMGRYRMARESFALIARQFPEMRGLAEYNLGLVAERLDENSTAEQHFRRAWDLSEGDQNLRYLAAQRLQDYVETEESRPAWNGAVGVRAGFDDNVALRDDLALPVGTTTESPMADLFANVSGPWRDGDGVRFEGSAYLARYADAGEFDQGELLAAAFYDWRLRDWRLRAGVHASTSTLGGDAFDRKFGVNARALYFLGERSTVEGRYTYDDISDADAMFAGIAGERHQLDLRYSYYYENHRLHLRYWLEENDRLDPGVSPERDRIDVLYRYQPQIGLGFEAGIEQRSSDYGDLETPRKEDLTTLRAALTWELPAAWLVLLELRSARNESNDPDFDYDRNQVTVGVMKYF